MFCSVLALLAILPSLVAVNGAVVQRDGTFTYTTPQPTTFYGQTSSSSQSSVTQTTSTTSSYSTTSATVPVSKSSSTYCTSPTSTYPPTSSSTVVIPPTTSVPTTTPICPHTGYQCAPPTGTPTETSAPSPSGTGGANCNGVQEWQSAFAYTSGNQVIYNNELFTALQWTYNNAPPSHLDQWSCGGVCSQPINNQASCKGVSAWQNSTAYSAGSKVTYNNHLWSAVQWVQSNAPGDNSGSWKDLGVCGW